HELGEGVGDGDDRFLEVFVLHPGGAPQSAGAGHVAAVGGGLRAVIGHDGIPATNSVMCAVSVVERQIAAVSGGCMTKRDHRSYGRGSRARRRISGEECCDSTPAEAGGERSKVEVARAGAY